MQDVLEPAQDTYETRTLTYETALTGGAEFGHAIRIQFYDANVGDPANQAGIDNITLSAASRPLHGTIFLFL